MSVSFPVIDPVATGQNIVRLRTARGLSVRDLQAYFGFEEPQAIYKWQRGKSLPSVDNLFALGTILEVPLDEILVPAKPHLNIISTERQAESCRSAFLTGSLRYDRSPRVHRPFLSLPMHTPLPARRSSAPWHRRGRIVIPITSRAHLSRMLRFSAVHVSWRRQSVEDEKCDRRVWRSSDDRLLAV